MINVDACQEDIDKNTSVYMELVQLLLRKWNINDGYNLCKVFLEVKLI